MKSSTSLNKLNNLESDLDLHDLKHSKRYVHSTSPLENHSALRKGKWTLEEEKYADKIIYMFNKGILQIPTGTTLRSYLSEKLNCDPMRITKKFAGPSCIGKQIFQPIEDRSSGASLSISCSSGAARTIDLSPTEIHQNELELENLEKIFRSRQGGGHLHNSSFMGTQHHSHASLSDHHHKQTTASSSSSSSSSSSHSKGLSHIGDNSDINYNPFSPSSSSSGAATMLTPYSDTDFVDHANSHTSSALKVGQQSHHTHSRSHSSTDAEDSGGDDHYHKPSRMSGKDNINSRSISGGSKLVESSNFMSLSPKSTAVSNNVGLISNQSNASISTHDSSGNNSTNNSGSSGVGLLMRRAISAPELQDLEVKWPKLTKKQQKQQQLLFNSNNINMNVESVPIKHLKEHYNHSSSNHHRQHHIIKATPSCIETAGPIGSSGNINTIGMGMSRKRCQSMINLFDFDDYFGNDLAAGDLLLGFFNTLTENESSPNLQHQLKQQQQPSSSQQGHGHGLEGFFPSLSLSLPPSLSRHISLSSRSDSCNRTVVAVLGGGKSNNTTTNTTTNVNDGGDDDIFKSSSELLGEPPVKRQAVESTSVPLPSTSDALTYTSSSSSSSTSSIDQDEAITKDEALIVNNPILSGQDEHININNNSSSGSSCSSTGSKSHETSESSDLDTIGNHQQQQQQQSISTSALQQSDGSLHHHYFHSSQQEQESRANMDRRESVSSYHGGSTDDDSHTHLSHLQDAHTLHPSSSPLEQPLQHLRETALDQITHGHCHNNDEEEDHEVGLSLED